MHLCPDALGFARDFYSSMLLLLFDATHQMAEGDIIDVVDRTDTNRQLFSSFFWVWGRGFVRRRDRQIKLLKFVDSWPSLTLPPDSFYVLADEPFCSLAFFLPLLTFTRQGTTGPTGKILVCHSNIATALIPHQPRSFCT